MNAITRLPIAMLLLAATMMAQQPQAKLPPLETMRLEFVTEKDGELIGRYADEGGQRILITASVAGETEAKRMREFIKPIKPETRLIDAAVAKLRNGEKPGEKELAECQTELDAYFDMLTEKYAVHNNTRFNPPDQVQYYLVMIRMSLLDHKNHGGWPFRSTLRLMVQKELKKQTADSKDPYLHFCAIFPSLAKEDVEHAVSCMKFVQQHDDFLAGVALQWASGFLPESEIKTRFTEAVQAK